MRYTISVLLLLLSVNAGAQTWRVTMGSGLTFAKLIPAKGSSPEGGALHYSYTKAGTYFGSEWEVKLNDNAEAGFAYNYTNIKLGNTLEMPGTIDVNYDIVDMHQFGLTFHVHIPLTRSFNIGAFANTGFAYTKMTGMGASGHSGAPLSVNPNDTVGSQITRMDQFDIMKGSWVPVTTVGISLSPVKRGWVAGRFAVNFSASTTWRDIYNNYAHYDYSIQSGSKTESGTIKYRGAPIIMQMGFNFHIFDFHTGKAAS